MRSATYGQLVLSNIGRTGQLKLGSWRDRLWRAPGCLASPRSGTVVICERTRALSSIIPSRWRNCSPAWGKWMKYQCCKPRCFHDVIEDTDTPPEEVAEMFGQQVASVVQELTDDERLPKAERRRLQVERAASLSRAAQQIRIADKICNLLDITPNQPKDWDEERKREYFDWAEQVVSRCRGVNLPLETYFYEVVSQKRQAVL